MLGGVVFFVLAAHLVLEEQRRGRGGCHGLWTLGWHLGAHEGCTRGLETLFGLGRHNADCVVWCGIRCPYHAGIHSFCAHGHACMLLLCYIVRVQP